MPHLQTSSFDRPSPLPTVQLTSATSSVSSPRPTCWCWYPPASWASCPPPSLSLPFVDSQYYGAQYEASPFPFQPTPQPNSGLALPKPNDLIPSNFELKNQPGPRSVPVRLLTDSPLLQLWFEPDTTFHLPKANVFWDFVIPQCYESPRSAVLARLYTSMVLACLDRR